MVSEKQIGDEVPESCLTLTAQAVVGALCMAGDAIEVKKLVNENQEDVKMPSPFTQKSTSKSDDFTARKRICM